MTPEHRHPRRRDRSKDEGWIRNMLHRGDAGVFAGVLKGLPVSLPRIYAYDPERECLYVHGAFGGLTGELMAQGDEDAGVPMSVTVFETGRFLPAGEALEFGVEYASVVLSGRAFEAEDEEEAERALSLIMKKYAPHLEPGRDYRPIAPEEILRTNVLRVEIDAWSGKEKREPPDFPGAYRLSEVR